MINGLNSIRRERASLERNRVIIGSMMEDAAIEDAFSTLDDTFLEAVSEDQLDELINRLPETDEEDEQVDKILKSKDDLNADQVLGVED